MNRMMGLSATYLSHLWRKIGRNTPSAFSPQEYQACVVTKMSSFFPYADYTLYFSGPYICGSEDSHGRHCHSRQTSSIMAILGELRSLSAHHREVKHLIYQPRHDGRSTRMRVDTVSSIIPNVISWWPPDHSSLDRPQFKEEKKGGETSYVDMCTNVNVGVKSTAKHAHRLRRRSLCTFTALSSYYV